MKTGIQVGDMVRYYPVLRPKGGAGDWVDYVVDEVRVDGIPSCREPMVKLRGKPGYVLASHCFVMEWMPSVNDGGGE